MISEKMMEMAKENVEASVKVMVKFLEDERLPKATAKYYSTLYKQLLKEGFTPTQAIELVSLPLG